MDRHIHVVGQGLAGSVLAMTLLRRKIPFTISGSQKVGEASMASSGLIAPVTGRRYVKAWRIDEFISYALEFYRWTESLLGHQYFYPVEIVRFLTNHEARKAWDKRLHDPEYNDYISSTRYPELDVFQKPYGILTGGYRLDTPGWIQAVRSFLADSGLLSARLIHPEADTSGNNSTIFATGALQPEVAKGIIPNKGESLVVAMPEWKIRQVIKDEVFIVPLLSPNQYWIGSFYQPGEDDPHPSASGRDKLMEALHKLHQGPIDILHHSAGVRPTVDDRRPLIGQRPNFPHQYMFNGMGTKGTSLAPFWADQLVSHLIENVPLPKEVSPARYQ